MMMVMMRRRSESRGVSDELLRRYTAVHVMQSQSQLLRQICALHIDEVRRLLQPIE